MEAMECKDTVCTDFEISDLKCVRKSTGQGYLLVAGSHDPQRRIQLFAFASLDRSAVEVGLQRPRVCNAHNSYVTHVDVSSDAQVVQSNCGAYELLYTGIAGEQIRSATSLRDELWSTWTCVLGWPVQGIWPACADGTDINAVDRSHSGSLLATADDLGKVKLFRFPCVEKTAMSAAYDGHSSHVTNVRWSLSDSHLISLGGADNAVFIWRCL
jgi:microtubule-associated protein-like 6